MGRARNWHKFEAFELLLADDNDGNNAPVITGIFRLEGEVTTAWAVRNIAQRFGTHPRFRSRIDLKRKVFIECTDFDAALHVERREETLTPDSFNALLSTPLAKDRPPWTLTVFAARNTDVSDIVFRVHHVVGDGVGLVQFALRQLADGTVPQTESKSPLPPRAKLHPALVDAGAAGTMMDKITRPFREVYNGTANLFFPDPRNSLNTGVLTPKKHAAWARPRSVHQLRAASRQLGVTLNDLLLGALAGAVRTYTLAFDKKVPKKVHTALPVNQHPPDSVDFVVNALTVVIMGMPIRHEEQRKRLAECTRLTREMKLGFQVPFSFMMFRLLASLPQSIQVPLWRHITKRVTLLFTNVPGPKETVICANRQVLDIRCLAPAQACTACVVSAFSYADVLNVGVWADASYVKHPQKFLDFYDAELAGLLEWTKRVGEADKQAVAGGSPPLFPTT